MAHDALNYTNISTTSYQTAGKSMSKQMPAQTVTSDIRVYQSPMKQIVNTFQFSNIVKDFCRFRMLLRSRFPESFEYFVTGFINGNRPVLLSFGNLSSHSNHPVMKADIWPL